MAQEESRSASAVPNGDFPAFLVTRGILDAPFLAQLIEHHRLSGQTVESNLVESGLVSEERLTELLAEFWKVPYHDVAATAFTGDQLNLLPEYLARRHCALPLSRDGKRLVLVMADPRNLDALQDIAFVTGCTVTAVLGARGQILDAIHRYYSRHLEGAAGLMTAGHPDTEDLFRLRASETSVLDAQGESAPVIQLLNLIMRKAIQLGASDIHIEPGIPEGTVRFRLDGLLVDQLKVLQGLHPALVSRLKILGRMDIAERRLPQDGSVRVKVADREVDLRLSTIPLRNGEKAVIRILDASTGSFDLDVIGFSETDAEKVRRLIGKHMGMVVMTGPTGSGKTTTLYAMLNRIKNRTINIVTVEDPIEYNYEGLNQLQVNADIDLTFASGLRSILRQDPDVILVGEIRDAETAEIACRAALTGHLVFSTLHTNDAPSSITRLLDIGVPRYLLASVLSGVIAQRLVRKVCPDCATPAPLDMEAVEHLGLSPKSLEGGRYVRGLGCSRCHDLGFRGRMGVFETLVLDPRVRELILRGATEEDIRLAAQEGGMHTLVEDGLAKTKAGQTTLAELGRVLEVGEFAANCCTECGRMLNSKYRYCPHCATPQRRFCPQCGNGLQPGWVVCAHCGHA